MNDLILVDPHSNDFMFVPLMFKIFGRKSLLKYLYIPKSIIMKRNKIQIYLSYESSSFPERFFKKLPFFLRKIIVDLEIIIWKRINEEYKFEILKSVENKKVFYFGHKKSYLFSHQNLSKAKIIFVHLSHYHGYKQYEFKSLIKDKINFCFDNDISNNSYFKSKFPWYNKKILIMPFQIQERFFKTDIDNERLNKCCITGTYHSYSKSEADWGIYNNNCTTLHPVRHQLANMNLPSYIDSKLSLFKKPDLIKFKLNDVKQKKYFSFDIAEYYSKYNYACVPGEGTGAIGIGSLEAMAAGCKVFLTNNEVKGLDIPSDLYVGYNSINDLLDKIENSIESNSKINKDIKFKIRESIIPFKEENLMKKFKEIIESY